jgi:outer membrane protein OmpA-like peptidoglycan-associated protein
VSGKARLLAVCCVWLVIIGIGSIAWKLIFVPRQEAEKQQAKVEQHNQTLSATSAESRYSVQVNFGLDGFSGYAPFRSEQFQNELGHKRIKVNLLDDGANYAERLRRLRDGELHIAAFPIDALITASAGMGDVPATVVCLVDETRGADAMVAYKTAVPNIDALNSADMKFVLTPQTPSETLSRVVISHFGLRNLPSNPFDQAKDAEDVYRRYRNSKPTDKQVFVLWEPYVTKMLENPNTQVLVDSSRFRGYIVDTIVVSRDFLVKNEAIVIDFVESYLRTVYHFSQNGNMAKLVAEDSAKLGQPLNEKQIERLVGGIWWKNTSENFAHLGVSGDRPLQHVEDMILNVTNVLKSTGAISVDPTGGRPNLLYYDKVLAKLQSNNFHPGVNAEAIRKDSDNLPALSEEQWKTLIPVGTLEVPTIVFARSRDAITEQSETTLNELVEKLKSWPVYYVQISSNVRVIGSKTSADLDLEVRRGEAVVSYLVSKGIGKNRIRSVQGGKNESSVSAVLLYPAY